MPPRLRRFLGNAWFAASAALLVVGVGGWRSDVSAWIVWLEAVAAAVSRDAFMFMAGGGAVGMLAMVVLWVKRIDFSTAIAFLRSFAKLRSIRRASACSIGSIG